jgi:hypothetical protein
MRLLVLALAALAGTSACRPPGESAPAPHSAYRGPLATSLQVQTLGDSVQLVLQVTNGTPASVTVTFPSGQTYDFSVLDGTEPVWTWSADRSFIQSVRMVTLAPGETRTHSEVWTVPAGMRGRTLTAVGRLTSSDHPVEHRTGFRVP